ncbi:undecaprenyl-phosphate 4-deoxy-4-formamido-L-arabinose transferase [Variibacter gotjawalensis]|uniref:Undecaprenyl-phosphate 4-deoxy-4-formamido-L-arabinose transferase n=2 Tax=Variibacter gotjawalensis TaxID=1333996 RepID=A0A0S3PP55_9BRAD|nr:glycosyltransferase involved in cell wall biosynthesis [Variibacter gotjawalensis]BAT57566.1 undecaprenyl-phosphate 4-deoxy-4-formamido-L-arabinose transferase [Variibacter gotjawalensis]
MPCLNEAETIGICVEKAIRFIERHQIAGEVLIADNGSTDGSQEIAVALGARVVSIPEKGYGAALLGGIAHARGDYCVMGDADDSYDFDSLQFFLAELRNGADLVMGNRFRGGIGEGAMPWLHRYLGNPVLSFIGRLFFKVPVGDFHCGLRGFNTERIRALRLLTTGMEFASEMVVKCSLAGYRIREVPTTLKKDGRSRAPHLRTWRDGWRHLKFLLMYSPRWLYFIPGGVLILVGFLSSALLFIAPLKVGAVVFDLNTFVIACFSIIVGVQVMTIGATARQYAALNGLLPWSERTMMLERLFSTDRMSVYALALILLGLIAVILGFASWAQHDFGDLGSSRVPRVVIAGLTLSVIGFQILFSGFLIGILRIPLSSHKTSSRQQ